MYREFYGIREKAFANTPDPRFLFLDERYEEALEVLCYAALERELALLTGDIGLGKSLLIRALLDRLADGFEVAVITNPRLSASQLLRAVAQELGIASPSRGKADLLAELQTRLLELDAAGTRVVLVIDEAQLIPSRSVFDEIRLLTNFQLDDHNLLGLVFVGQVELKRRLSQPAYRALTQRIGASIELAPLDEAGTRRYVAHRLSVVGAKDGLFDEDALSALFAASGGVPRVINNLATQALLEGTARGAPMIGGEIVRAVAASMMFAA